MMKSKEQLEELANEIYWLLEHGKIVDAVENLHALQEVDRDPQMPGAWRCPKCEFTLQSNVMTPSGVFAKTQLAAPERCPNDNTILEPLTWRQANKQWSATCMLEIRRLNWLDEHCSFVANYDYNLGPFKVGELRKLADAGIAEDEKRSQNETPEA